MTEAIVYYLDTSTIHDHLHGDSRQQAQVWAYIGDGSEAIRSSFVRMEYLRSRIFSHIHLYFCIKEEDSVEDGIQAYLQMKSHSNRAANYPLQSIKEWITDQDDWANKPKTLRRLGETICRMVYDFDEYYCQMRGDGISCQLGKLVLKKATYSEDIILDFVDAYDSIYAGVPTCRLCEFKRNAQAELTQKKVDLFSDSHKQRYKKNKGFLKQIQQLVKVPRIKDVKPKCSRCVKLGDSIIALQSRKECSY